MSSKNNAKLKVSISIDVSLLEEIESYVASSVFRNRSHSIEFAVKRFVEDGRRTR